MGLGHPRARCLRQGSHAAGAELGAGLGARVLLSGRHGDLGEAGVSGRETAGPELHAAPG